MNEKNYHSDPLKLEIKEEYKVQCTPYYFDNQFIFIDSIEYKDNYLIFSSNNWKNLVLYSFNNKEIIQIFLNLFDIDIILSIRKYTDSPTDYILTTSNNKIKIFIINEEGLTEYLKFEKIFDISKSFIYSCSLIFDEELDYIIIPTGNTKQYIKVLNMETGEIIKEIHNSNYIYFIDTYNNENDIFLILGTESNGIFVYSFTKNKLYFCFIEKNDSSSHYCAIMRKNDLIESCDWGFIRIWDFDKKELKNKINMNSKIIGITLWDDNYLFVSNCEKPYKIKILDLEKGEKVKKYKGHNGNVISFQKILHPKYGESLLSISSDKTIRLWSSENYLFSNEKLEK